MIDYTKAIQIHKDMQKKTDALNAEYQKRMREAYGDKAKLFSDPLICFRDIQVYPDAPSRGAEYSFTDEYEGAASKFYRLKADGVNIIEVIREGAKE